ncbi:MAG TPA: arsenite efflux transporter metallochaperone ArsD, partial [Nitrospira sp.]|nr:arsenite efflux transporter metallochaperone ArsD [Nitrospira sp.]
GVCGPKVDPVLVRFAADLHWLANQRIAVERYNMAQQPQAFAASAVVKTALQEHGNECLPLILLDGSIVSQGHYPTRAELARLAGVELDAPAEVSAGAKG